ncbi:Unknown protein, partial [Striga hermonthica]
LKEAGARIAHSCFDSVTQGSSNSMRILRRQFAENLMKVEWEFATTMIQEGEPTSSHVEVEIACLRSRRLINSAYLCRMPQLSSWKLWADGRYADRKNLEAMKREKTSVTTPEELPSSIQASSQPCNSCTSPDHSLAAPTNHSQLGFMSHAPFLAQFASPALAFPASSRPHPCVGPFSGEFPTTVARRWQLINSSSPARPRHPRPASAVHKP